MVRMMCPGISYSTVHSFLLHTDGSVQGGFKEFCDRKQANFAYHVFGKSINAASINEETRALKNQPWELKYDDRRSPITEEYEVITTFIKIHNISSTWEVYNFNETIDTSYQLKVGSFFCDGHLEGPMFECCPPM